MENKSTIKSMQKQSSIKQKRKQDRLEYDNYWKNIQFGAPAPAKKELPRYSSWLDKKKNEKAPRQFQPHFNRKSTPTSRLTEYQQFQPKTLQNSNIEQKKSHAINNQFEEQQKKETHQNLRTNLCMFELQKKFNQLSIDRERPIRPLKYPIQFEDSMQDSSAQQSQQQYDEDFSPISNPSLRFMRMLQRAISEEGAFPAETVLENQINFIQDNHHKPLKKKKIKKIPVLKVSEDMLKSDCSICYMEFKLGKLYERTMVNCYLGESYMSLKCEHKFHPDCINKWFQTREICPNCRTNLG